MDSMIRMSDTVKERTGELEDGWGGYPEYE